MKLPATVVGGLHSLSLAGLLGQAAVVAGNPLPPKAGRATVADGTASLHQGTVKGFTDSHGNSVFLGIPFAESTGGQNRWKAPKDVKKLKKGEVLDATKYGATCPQAITTTTWSQQGEDCLNLNIWVPSLQAQSKRAPPPFPPHHRPRPNPHAVPGPPAPPAGPDAAVDGSSGLPVFVYMYGGAMVTGSSSNPSLVGSNFANKGVVFVSFNTRESLWAYPNSAELADGEESQNFGILDVDQALQWVRDNIAQFGGNPDHVVFGGHSSGSVQVDHYLWNHPDTWLAGAVQMAANAKSGPAVGPTNQALDLVAKEVNCPTGEGQLKCLREVDMYTFQTEAFNATLNTYFTPVVDEITRYRDYAARFAAGNYASHVPLLTGNSDHEGALFGLVYGSENTDFSEWINTFDADVAQIPDDILLGAYNISDYSSVSAMSGAQYGDARFFCPVDYLLDVRSEKQDTWVYRFFGNYSNILPLPVEQPTHGAEIPFFFGGNDAFTGMEDVTEAEQALADFQNDWFVNFIKNPSAGPGWDKASPQSGPIGKLGVPGNELEVEVGNTADFNGKCQNVYNPYAPLYPVIQSVLTGAMDLVEGVIGN
ncbi:acetylcholinesterase precursor [Stemphylium lycopersici]|uniref:Acetylcholinesterase n=1 Tax=Stemphylium lycopersici TaxID=183478 RepID=A0A364N4X3_STELY|nr:acetylcholinesterase precursor [Stemphylium lycopersici]RAR12140.1 acetylcholinesterase precursor [Stemphylium lycopersici]